MNMCAVERSRKRFARHVCVFQSDTVEPCDRIWDWFVIHTLRALIPPSSLLFLFDRYLIHRCYLWFGHNFFILFGRAMPLFINFRGFVTFPRPPSPWDSTFNFKHKCFSFMNTNWECVKMQPELISSQESVFFLNQVHLKKGEKDPGRVWETYIYTVR